MATQGAQHFVLCGCVCVCSVCSIGVYTRVWVFLHMCSSVHMCACMWETRDQHWVSFFCHIPLVLRQGEAQVSWSWSSLSRHDWLDTTRWPTRPRHSPFSTSLCWDYNKHHCAILLHGYLVWTQILMHGKHFTAKPCHWIYMMHSVFFHSWIIYMKLTWFSPSPEKPG